jgi:hypothetical protein
MVVKEAPVVAAVACEPVAAKRALVPGPGMAAVSAVVVENTADVAALEVVPYLGQMVVSTAEAAGVGIVAAAAAVIVEELSVESVGAILEEKANCDHTPNAIVVNRSRGPAFW